MPQWWLIFRTWLKEVQVWYCRWAIVYTLIYKAVAIFSQGCVGTAESLQYCSHHICINNLSLCERASFLYSVACFTVDPVVESWHTYLDIANKTVTWCWFGYSEISKRNNSIFVLWFHCLLVTTISTPSIFSLELLVFSIFADKTFSLATNWKYLIILKTNHAL